MKIQECLYFSRRDDIYKVQSEGSKMPIHGPRFLPSIEIPIARIFRKITGRKMTEAEMRCFRIKASYLVRTDSRLQPTSRNA
jgi:hypothetical protein